MVTNKARFHREHRGLVTYLHCYNNVQMNCLLSCLMAELDVGDAWELDEEDDDLSCYGGEDLAADLPPEDIVTIKVDKRKASTGSQVRARLHYVMEPCDMGHMTVWSLLIMGQLGPLKTNQEGGHREGVGLGILY